MLREVSLGTMYVGGGECVFQGDCENRKNCSLVSLILEKDDFNQVRSLHLQPETVSAVAYGGKPGDDDLTRVDICERKARDPRIIEGVRILLTQKPDILVSEEDFAGFEEADRVYKGEISDLDEITTDAGLEMFDRMTDPEVSRNSFYGNDVKLTVTDEGLKGVYTYGSFAEQD